MTGLHSIGLNVPEQMLLACASLMQYDNTATGYQFRIEEGRLQRRRSYQQTWGSFDGSTQLAYIREMARRFNTKYLDYARQAFVS